MILIYIDDQKKKNFIDITCAFLMKSETFFFNFEKKSFFNDFNISENHKITPNTLGK